MNIFLAGWPKDIGGANTEAWHTLRLWRDAGLEVTVIPTWASDPPDREKVEAIGCRVVTCKPEDLHRVKGLAGSIVVAFCNTRFLEEAARFRALACKIVWVNCMNWQFPQERLHQRAEGLFDRYVFQSQYQRDQLIPQLQKHGDPQYTVIRGAFDCDLFPCKPLQHIPGERFIIGKLSRAAYDKFPADLWEQYKKIPHPIHARVMGWSDELDEKCGPPPAWATVMPEGMVQTLTFLRNCHTLVTGVDTQAVENWPRVGLEAMAAGVPIVAERRGGWCEMIDHGRTGLLCETANEQAYQVARLAYDEDLRQAIIVGAREAVQRDLADPGPIATAWMGVFGDLA